MHIGGGSTLLLSLLFAPAQVLRTRRACHFPQQPSWASRIISVYYGMGGVEEADPAAFGRVVQSLRATQAGQGVTSRSPVIMEQCTLVA